MKILKLIFNILYVVLLRRRYIGFNLLEDKVRVSFIKNLLLILGILVLIFGITIGQLRFFNEKNVLKEQIYKLIVENKINPTKIKCKNRLHHKEQKLVCRLTTKDHLIDINCNQTYSLTSGCKIIKIKERI